MPSSNPIQSEHVTEIHNGEVLNPNPLVKTESAQSATKRPLSDLDPEALAGLMAKTVSEFMSKADPWTPMELVNALLQLQTPTGQKVVWTRFDIHQLFALWTRKLEQRAGK